MSKRLKRIIEYWGAIPLLVLFTILPLTVVAAVTQQVTQQQAAVGTPSLTDGVGVSGCAGLPQGTNSGQSECIYTSSCPNNMTYVYSNSPESNNNGACGRGTTNQVYTCCVGNSGSTNTNNPCQNVYQGDGWYCGGAHGNTGLTTHDYNCVGNKVMQDLSCNNGDNCQINNGMADTCPNGPSINGGSNGNSPKEGTISCGPNGVGKCYQDSCKNNTSTATTDMTVGVCGGSNGAYPGHGLCCSLGGWAVSTGNSVNQNSVCNQDSSCIIGQSNCFANQQDCQTWINDHKPSSNGSSSSNSSSSSSTNSSSSSSSSSMSFVCAGSGIGAGCPPTPTPTAPLSVVPSNSSSISAVPSNMLSGVPPTSGTAICSQASNKACGYTDNCSGQAEGATCERQVNGCNKDSSGNNIYICKNGKWVYDHWVNKNLGTCNFCGGSNNNLNKGNFLLIILQLFELLFKIIESILGISNVR